MKNMNPIILGIGSDAAGFRYKKEILKSLKDNYRVIDFGIYDETPIKNYKVAEDVALAVINKRVEKGILICGTGLGISIAANKVKGVTAALCNDLYTAKKSREHNNADILAFGARVIGLELAKNIVQTWLNTEFEGARHIERNDYFRYLEKKY